MKLTGNLKIHKTDAATRPAEAVEVLPDGSLAVWDDVEEDTYGGEGIQVREARDIGEPDLIVRPDQYERVEREGHPWKRTSMASVKEMAKRRDDVDEEELPDNL